MAIWQDLVDQHGFKGGYESVRQFVYKLLKTAPEARVVIETPPGEEAQVDMVPVRWSAIRKRASTDVHVFSFSRSATAARPFGYSHSAPACVWAELHERAFRQLGGATKTIVLDTLREGVLAPDICDPSINPVYQGLLRHYGAVAVPCRVRHPDRKGQSRVRRRPHTENSFERVALRKPGGRTSVPDSFPKRNAIPRGI